MSGAALAVLGPVDVARARQLAARAARAEELPTSVVERVTLATSELATNLAKYATGGQLIVVPRGGSLDVIVTDRGPGIEDVPTSLRDGYSTSGSLGLGLGGVRRLADEFDIYSLAGEGTTVLARWCGGQATGDGAVRPTDMKVGAALVPAPGETESGDNWTVVRAGEVITVALSDGLGHGPDAALASAAAMEKISAAPAASPARLVAAMDADRTVRRGATVAVAQFHLTRSSMLFSGVGNSTVRLVRSDGHHEALVSTPGIVGRRQRSGSRALPIERPWDGRGWLVMHTDGITERWSPAENQDVFAHDPATVAGWLLGRYSRQRDDSCVVVVSGVHTT